MKTFYCSFSPETGVITGLREVGDKYPTPTPTPFIIITDDQHCEYFAKGQRHRVINGEFVYVEPVESLDDAKAAQWAVIKAERDRREVEPLPYLGKVLDFDDISSKRLTWAINAARTAIAENLPFSVDWTCYDNSVLTLTANDIIGIPLAVAQRSDSLHQIARNLREDIYSKNTVEEVKAIVWPT